MLDGMRRISVAIGLLALSLTPAATAATPGLAVTGYALGGTGARVIAASAPAMTTVTVDGVSITADGAGVQAPDASLASVRRAAHALGLRTELLVSNYSDQLGDFDPSAAHRLLTNPANIARLARTMAGFVAAGGYNGVNLDLESLRRSDAPGLVQLATALQRAMPARRTVSVDVSATTTVADYRAMGYAPKMLAGAVDVIQLMAYDEHGPTWSGPGPIGGFGWQQQSLDALLSLVPAAKVDLGQAGYGYTWPVSGTGHDVTDAGARALVRADHATAVWHPGSGEWSATLSDGTRLWWADARSYAIRKAYAARRHLHGLAVWVLGSADTLR
jgi:spore germination protein YaaH